MSSDTDVDLRPATMADAELMFAWQSDPRTRRHFRNPSAPSWDEHRAWLAAKLADPDAAVTVIRRHEHDAGVLRMDRDEVAILVDPMKYGQGIGRAALRLAPSLARGTTIHASVRAENDASMALFKAAGYGDAGRDELLLHGIRPRTARIMIAADAGKGIGLGHVSRAVGIWKALRRRGAEVELHVPDAQGLAAHLEARGIDARFGCDVTAEFQRTGADALVLDHKRLTAGDLVRQGVRAESLFLFVDSEGPHPKAAGLIDGAGQEAGNDDTLRLFGPAYQVVRDDLQRRAMHDPTHPPERMLITVGGDDPRGLTPRLIAWVTERVAPRWPQLRVDVVSGPFAPEVAGGAPAMRVHVAPKNMAELIANADIAVAGAGQTMFELAYCGVPIIALEGGTDQRRNLASMTRLGCVAATSMEALDSTFADLMQHASKRGALSKAALRLIDDKGADRIAAAIDIHARLNRR